MDRIEWSDEFSMGVGLFDQQHKQLLSLVNSLTDSSGTHDDKDNVAGTMAELLQFAYEHFAYEERVMLQYGYPDYELHKREHLDFIHKTKALSEAAQLRVSGVPEWLLIHVRQWFGQHIREEDMKCKDFLKDSGMT
ncbi:MAG: bacteriohemerythrin [Pseudomonadales bacterium]|jgi:hemerythrin|nr:bacteriohemerythrin [Pseudomonadales bacterium]MDP7146467.1 bacteriohemerythrin [Pseudomonadales bacterium]MDP7358647.1 bacteriohemerythrin [Pseudomonadales bacterium]MDP7596846.1 bacteriohemerythrin [Pseudomonadales bacterium]HJN52238.1 bacteriohemerythrin [Pseudomonadales bacterium]|tara:strand:+ start:498 stop:905 length:408 start_codon:yes stop_codon:yes gene_type:complete